MLDDVVAIGIAVCDLLCDMTCLHLLICRINSVINSDPAEPLLRAPRVARSPLEVSACVV